MSIAPIITFKAGRCNLDVRLPTQTPILSHPLLTEIFSQTTSRPWKVTPEEDRGYIYLYSEDGLFAMSGATRIVC